MTNPTLHPPLLAWLASMGESERQAFYADLAAAVASARDADEPHPIEACLRQWRLTAESIANAKLREQLLEP